MPLTVAAQDVYKKLSDEAQKRIEKLLKREGKVHHSDISTILTSPDWQNLAITLFGKGSVFELSSLTELNKLLSSPDFWERCDQWGYIKSLFLTHYRDLLKEEGESGNLEWDKEIQKKYEPKRATKSPSLGSSTDPAEISDVDKSRTWEKDRIAHKVKLLKSAYNIILHGAPGTGKTYLAKQIAKELGCSDEHVKMVQFHPSYDYTDFMEGLRPKKEKGSETIGFERRNGAFKEFCKKAIEAKKSVVDHADESTLAPFVFIIDEINRGEISKILGECMFSIDPGYVGEDGRIETQYQNLIEDASDPFKNGFYRPKNVYIIGTMNDIDRGVESMDLAMRRRFQFLEIKAVDTQEEILQGLEDTDLINDAKVRMNSLNEVIRNTPELGEDYCIGASYFLKVKNLADNKWLNLWEYHLKGLLKEYVRGLEDNSLMEQFRKAYNSTDVPLPTAEEDREKD